MAKSDNKQQESLTEQQKSLQETLAKAFNAGFEEGFFAGMGIAEMQVKHMRKDIEKNGLTFDPFETLILQKGDFAEKLIEAREKSSKQPQNDD